MVHSNTRDTNQLVATTCEQVNLSFVEINPLHVLAVKSRKIHHMKSTIMTSNEVLVTVKPFIVNKLQSSRSKLRLF
jgi:hypothetical protein